MNEPTIHTPGQEGEPTREQILAAMFANMVIQQTNMAMMLMGKVAHPESGEFVKDLDAAKMFIDQLEMLEAKTKGNLSKQEDGLMKQALSALHMTFVEAVEGAGEEPQVHAHEQPSAQPGASASAPAPAAEAAPKPSTTEPAPSPAVTPEPAAEESRKRFSKKY
ncbi:MAG TPA: DUF1844 domain-containing protein [Verrucomicrobiae bacterium]|jgi:hypothetical protein|nr:DUF1844 domain-containing protein [Verrucomicrobiae bacterium]